MTYLLDTHYMIWAVTSPKKIPLAIREVIADPDNRIIVSAISFWEVSLKCSVGKLQMEGIMPEDLPSACIAIGFELAPLSVGDSSTYHILKAEHHKDPFDRMLIWQAISNDYIFISTDTKVKLYQKDGLKMLG